MFRIDHATAAAVLPTPDPAGTPGFFTKGDPLLAIPRTRVTQDWANAVQEEIANAVEGMDQTLDKGGRFQLLQTILRAAAHGSTGNVLANGDFRFWQRRGFGAVAATNTLGFHGPDRWLFKSGNAGATLNLSQVTLVSSAEISPSGIETVLRWNKSVAGGAGEVSMISRVERAQTFQARKVVVAFDARKAAGTDLPIVSVELVQNFGTGGSSAVVLALTPTAGLTIDSTWRRLVFTGTLATTVGKTIVAGDNYLELRIKFGENVAADVYLTAFVLSRGTVDPGYFQRPFVQELALCQRYFASSRFNPSSAGADGGTDGAALGMWDTGYNLGASVGTLERELPVRQYESSGARSVKWYALDGTVNSITRESATVDAVTSGAVSVRSTGVPTITAPPATGTVRQYRAHWASAAEIGTET